MQGKTSGITNQQREDRINTWFISPGLQASDGYHGRIFGDT